MGRGGCPYTKMTGVTVVSCRRENLWIGTAKGGKI